MLHALMALMLLGQEVPPGTSHGEKIFLGVVASRPVAWIGKHIETCGVLRKESVGGREVYILTDQGSSDLWAIYVSPKLAGDKSPGRNCFSGIWQRVDGMSRAQVEARGWDTLVADGVNYDYLLGPSAS
jgi:hypothetical protein